MLRNHNITRYFMASIGLTCIIYYVWFRFIRTRLPRDIPFDLTILGFAILFILCGIYTFILWRYYRPKTPHPFILNLLIYASKMLKPLYVLDELLQYNRYYKLIYHKILHIIVKNVNGLTQNILINNKYSKNEDDAYINSRNDFNFNVKYKLFPKMFILVIFVIDIFYFQKLDYFYTCLIFGTYYLLWRYLYFSAAKILEDTISFLEHYYFVYVIPQDEAIEEDYYEPREDLESATAYYGYHDYYDDDNYFFDSQIGTYNWDSELYTDLQGLTNVRYFVDIQTKAFYFDYTPYKYTCMERPKTRKEFCKKHNIKMVPLIMNAVPPCDDISKAIAKDFNELMPLAIDLSVFLKRKDQDKYPDIKKLEMLIIFGYLLCWSYILIVSLHTLNVLDILELLKDTYKNAGEPF